MRSIADIAAEIQRAWKNPFFGAVPYINAMSTMRTVDDDYGADSGFSIIAGFLGNATSWRGDIARRVKKELKDALDEPRTLQRVQEALGKKAS